MTPQPRLLPSRRPRRKLHLLPPPPPCADVLGVLATALNRADDGELRAVAVAGLTRDSGITTAWAHGDQDWRLLPVAVEHLRARLYADD